MRFMKRNQKGFTLIELVVVVAVLAILAVVAVPVVSGIVGDSKKSSDASQTALYQSSIERHNAAEGAYPVSAVAARTAIVKYTNLQSVVAPKQGASYHFYYHNTGKIVCATALPAAISVSGADVIWEQLDS